MGDPLIEFEFEKHVATLVASSTQSLPSQLDISTEEDVASLRRDSSIQAALKNCDDTVDQLRRMQIQLEEAAAEINRQTASIRSALTPIMSLPPEILSEIFSLVVLARPIDWRPKRVLRMAPVCRKWRYTALSTGNLWSLCITSWTEAQQATWLARSSPGPIDILVNGRGSVAAPLHLELCHEAFRWRSIMLRGIESHVEITSCLDTLMKLPDLRNLQTINLTSWGSYAPIDNAERDARDFQSTLPRLKSVTISYFNISNMFTIAENLTVLYLHRVAYPFMEWQKLLESCQNLEILTLSHNKLLDSGSDQPGSALEAIVLPRLQELAIEADKDGLGHIVFNYVSAPLLRTLSVCHCCVKTRPKDLCMSIRLFLQHHHTIVTLMINTYSWVQDVFDWLSTSPDVTIDSTLVSGYNQPLPNLKPSQMKMSYQPASLEESLVPENVSSRLGIWAHLQKYSQS